MFNSSIPFEDYLYKRLKNKRYAAGYLAECFDDSLNVFLLGLRHVIEANGGFTKLAKLSGLSREHLYTMLSAKGNPRITNLVEILNSLGIKFSFVVERDNKRKAA
jgi:probable addiction module antidote protein